MVQGGVGVGSVAEIIRVMSIIYFPFDVIYRTVCLKIFHWFRLWLNARNKSFFHSSILLSIKGVVYIHNTYILTYIHVYIHTYIYHFILSHLFKSIEVRFSSPKNSHNCLWFSQLFSFIIYIIIFVLKSIYIIII